MKKSYVIAIIVFVALVMVTVIFLLFHKNDNTQTLTSSFIKFGNFSTRVDQALIDSSITYTENYYVTEAKKSFSNLDLTKTLVNYICTYDTTAKDDQYLYINLTCGGDPYNLSGIKDDSIALTNFSKNPTRFKYSHSDDTYTITEIFQPIDNQQYYSSLPIEYINLLAK